MLGNLQTSSLESAYTARAYQSIWNLSACYFAARAHGSLGVFKRLVDLCVHLKFLPRGRVRKWEIGKCGSYSHLHQQFSLAMLWNFPPAALLSLRAPTFLASRTLFHSKRAVELSLTLDLGASRRVFFTRQFSFIQRPSFIWFSASGLCQKNSTQKKS